MTKGSGPLLYALVHAPVYAPRQLGARDAEWVRRVV